jgi:hypothetical protein
VYRGETYLSAAAAYNIRQRITGGVLHNDTIDKEYSRENGKSD